VTGTDLGALARQLKALHGGPRILVLANAWDAASARILESEGFPAIATTSAGVAWSLGYGDGEKAPFSEVLAAIRRITRVVRVPVTADVEAGFGTTPRELAETCRAVLDAGAVGMNLEDGRDDPAAPVAEIPEHAARVQAVREAADGRGVPLVVNARTDIYLRQVGRPDGRFDEAVRRAEAYRRAGADCIFVPGVSDAETIGRLARAIPAPVNVLAAPGTPPVAELERLGVARLSVGSRAIGATSALLRRIGRELRERGTYGSLFADTIPYDEMNRLLA
jgi:2-methylisocitrate lyase-like PEP mutase family enzyme